MPDKGPCTVAGCDRDAKVKGWCQRHYNNANNNNGDPGPGPLVRASNAGKECQVLFCREPAKVLRYCNSHYWKLQKYSDPFWSSPYRPTPHGTPNSYGYYNCRCWACTLSNTDRKQAWVVQQDAENIPHGTQGGYTNWKCRCPLCLAAGKEGNDVGSRKWGMRWRFGLSEQDIEALLNQQNDACYICQESFDLTAPRPFHVDHDHGCCPPVEGKRTNKTCGSCVRSLLCYRCNVGLGYVKESIARLEGMISYIKLNPRYQRPE